MQLYDFVLAETSRLVRDLQDDEYNGVDDGANGKLQALEPYLFEQSVQIWSCCHIAALYFGYMGQILAVNTSSTLDLSRN